MLYPPIQGAYTELFAGLSPEVTTAQNGAFGMCDFLRCTCYLCHPWRKALAFLASLETSKTMQRLTEALVFPWGRLGPEIRKDLVLAQRSEKEGGTGTAEKFWDWCDEQVKPYM